MEVTEKRVTAQQKVAAHDSAHASRQNQMLAIFFTVCCFAAPILTGLASFDIGELKTLGSIGGVLGMYGMTLWIGAIMGMAWLLWRQAPRLTLVTASLGIIGCIGGSNFVIASMFRTKLMAAGVDQELIWFTGSDMAIAGALVSVAMGPWFPLALILFGIGLTRFKVIPAWLGGLLIVGGIGFPLGRIPGDAIFIHTTDVLVFTAMAVLGWRYMRMAD